MAERSPPEAKRARREDSNFAGESSRVMSEEILQCPACHNVFRTRSRERLQWLYCPTCKRKISMELQITPAQRVVQREVLCDVCTGNIEKAIKSCLDCCVSFCTSHLEPHHVAPNYKKHKLINAVENLGKYICQKHKRPLELFCRYDQKFVCPFCTEGDHKNHKVISLEEESRQRKSQLGKTNTELQQMIQERLKKIRGINHSVERNKRKTEKEKADSLEVLNAVIRSIKRSQDELLLVMEKKQKAAEKQAEGLVKELEQEISELKMRYTELEKLSQSDDHLLFLQTYQSLCCTPHTRTGTEIRIDTEVNVDALRMALSQLQKTLNEKLEETVSTELKRIQQYAVDVTLDPDTAHPNIVLSDDGKQLTYADNKQNYPDLQKRFTNYITVLGKQGFPSGRFYYEVQVSRKTKWDLGVVRESVIKKGRFKALKPQNGFWTMVLRKGNEYNARDESLIPLFLIEKPQKVGVFVDYEEGLVSFYNVEGRSHIYSFTGQSFTEKLYPFFSPGSDSAPMIISQINLSNDHLPKLIV